MSKVITGNGGFTVPWLELKVLQRVEGNSRNPCIQNFSFFLARSTVKLNQTAPNSYYL